MSARKIKDSGPVEEIPDRRSGERTQTENPDNKWSYKK